MYKLEFTLKQHTPIIHFQHDQDGATLRATEVKPKLDRFIIEKCGFTEIVNGKVCPKPEFKNYFINEGKQHLALDYKLKIGGSPTKKVIIASRLSQNQSSLIRDKGFEVIPVSPHFAQEKDFGKELFVKVDPNNPNNKNFKFKDDRNALNQISNFSKLGIISNQIIHCSVICFNEHLKKKLEKNLAAFFLSENFGTRQSKGFGSYTVEEINGEKVNTNFESELIKIFDIVYEKQETFDNVKAFSEIQSDYKLVKAGKGSPEGYAKSRLFLYFAKKGIRWEKRWIKRKLKPLTESTPIGRPFSGFTLKTSTISGFPIDIDESQDWNDKPINNQGNNGSVEYNFIRAVLGLAEMYDFATNNSNNKISVKIKISDDVERYRSPILFKIIEKKIYLVANDNIPLEILSMHNPTFSASIKNHEKIIDSSTIILSGSPKIPKTFSLKEFLQFCFLHDKTNLGMKDTDYLKIENYNKLK